LYSKSLKDYKSPLLAESVDELPAYYPYEKGQGYERTEETAPETSGSDGPRTVPEPAVVDADRELIAYADDAIKRVSPQQALREEEEEERRYSKQRQLDVLLYAITGLLIILFGDLLFRIGLARGAESVLKGM
jgi:hypothetical protein